MIRCPSCNTEIPQSANFCSHCGISLKTSSNHETKGEIDSSISSETVTQALKRLMPTSYVEKLLASKGKMEGERRIVTILFSDIKGSTSLAENLDPEEVLEVMNGAFNFLIEPITRYEGTLARLMGDAILAFFGAPITHEDDPYRACRAALDILKGAEEFRRKLEHEKNIKGFAVRVGINTGLVVVAEVGTDLRVEYTAMGDTVNIAARMESAAEPGTILITEATKKLIQKDFELLSMGSIQVKGKSEPIHTYRVLDIKKSDLKKEFSVGFHSPLIGREIELNKLKEVFNRLRQGSGAIVSIIGESGSGKSRLVAESRNQNFPDLKWVEARALTYTINKSYWLVSGLLKNYLGFHQESSDLRMLDVLYKKVVDNFGDEAENIYPYIEYFLKLSSGESDPNGIKFDDLRAARGQFHYFVKEFIKRESIRQPIILSWEDLQWCDLPSLEFLNELLPLVGEKPIVLLLQYRIDENEKRIWDFYYNNLKEYKDKHEVISLRLLKDDESVLFIKNLLGNQELPLEIQNQVIFKTEGNPYFIEEVIHSIVEADSFSLDKSSSGTSRTRGEFQIPGLVQNVIMSRVDSLEPQDKITLQTASVIGRIFQKNLLVNVLRDKPTVSDFEESLYELQVREFILRHLPLNIKSQKMNLQKEYIFKQDIAQNVIYSTLLLSQRQDLHRQIGEQIEYLYSNTREDFADSLASHFEKGKVLDKARYYFRIAANRARDLFANDNAMFYYSKVLELSDQSQSESLDLAQIHESIGEIYSLRGEYSLAINHFNLASNYYKNSSNLSKIYYRCGQVYERWGNYGKALENYHKGLFLIKKQDSKKLVAHIYNGMGMVFYRQGKLMDAKKICEKALRIFKKLGDNQGAADVYNNTGIIYSELGDLQKSLEYHQKCLQIREKTRVTSSLASSYNNLGYLFQIKNDLEKAIEYYNKSLVYCEKIGNQHGLARIYDNLSQIYISLGNKEMAVELNLKAISIIGKITNGISDFSADVWSQSGVW